ncbi:MAG TPA: lysylphosphatidylglycerol synthase transmembrane domain-containing protein [Armatimonadota bacterium]|nr:lysylphosphatidylglycerol synthase transmembrane domain-containing protein [Armatimonadota bacterium]
MKTVTSLPGGVLASPDTRRLARWGVRATLALALIGWLVWKGGWRGIGESLLAVSPGWFLLSLALYLAGQTLCAWKWGLLAGALGLRRSPAFYWVTYLGAMFPSLFLPTSVGGDIFRALALGGSEDKQGATVSVLADRGTGVLAMSWLAALSVTLRPQGAFTAVLQGLSIALTAGFLLPFAFRSAAPRNRFVARVLECWRQPTLLLATVAMSLLFQLLVCGTYLVLGSALRLPVEPLFYLYLCPIVSVAALSPITLNGLGERVAALVLLLGLVGVGADQAVALGLAWTGMVAAASLCGGVVLLCWGEQVGSRG